MKQNARKSLRELQLHTRSITEWRRLHLPGSPSKIQIDPELRAFVDERLPTMTLKQIAAACVKRFGRKRAPGKSAVHRYWTTFHAASARQR